MRSSIDKDLAGFMVIDYMRKRRSKKSGGTLPFPLFGKDFPVGGTRATLVPNEHAQEELVEDNELPDNIDELLQQQNDDTDQDQEHTDDDENQAQEHQNDVNQSPIPEDEEEFIEGVIYPQNARQFRPRNNRIDYYMMHRSR